MGNGKAQLYSASGTWPSAGHCANSQFLELGLEDAIAGWPGHTPNVYLTYLIEWLVHAVWHLEVPVTSWSIN